MFVCQTWNSNLENKPCVSKSNFASLFSRTRISLSNLCLVSDRVDDSSAFSATTLNPTIFNIIHWVAGLLGQMTHWPSIWCSKHYIFFYNWNDFCKEFCKKLWKKNNTWNIRCMIDETIVPSTQRPSVSYWRLSDF